MDGEVRLAVANHTAAPVDLIWLGDDARDDAETHYATVPPGASHDQATFSGHRWRVRAHEARTMLAEICTSDEQVHTLVVVPDLDGTAASSLEPPPAEVKLHVRNRSDRVDAELLWLDGDAEVPYAVIRAGGSLVQRTHGGAAWRCRSYGAGALHGALLAEVELSSAAVQTLTLDHAPRADLARDTCTRGDADEPRPGRGRPGHDAEPEPAPGSVELTVANHTAHAALWLGWVGASDAEETCAQVHRGGLVEQCTHDGFCWRVRSAPTELARGVPSAHARAGSSSAHAAADDVDSGMASVRWRLTVPGGLLAEVRAGSAPKQRLSISSSACADVHRFYTQRRYSAASRLCVCAAAAVDARALESACTLIDRMLLRSPPRLCRRLRAARARVAIIGRAQSTSELPDQRAAGDASHCVSAADVDRTRGLGGTAFAPVSSVGEENLLDISGDPHYPHESVLIHEFGHAVMNLGLDSAERRAVRAAYRGAIDQGLYSPGSYMGSSAEEYWAEGTQAWFGGSCRADVNDGCNSREALRAHDAALGALLASAYGEGEWRFTSELPSDARNEWLTRQGMCVVLRAVSRQRAAMTAAASGAAPGPRSNSN